MSGSSLDEYRRFSRFLRHMPLEGHGRPHLSRLQLKELRRILHPRIRGEGFQALQRQHQAPPKRPWQSCQGVIHAQARGSLDAGLVGNLIDPALDRAQARWGEGSIHRDNTQVHGNLVRERAETDVRSLRPGSAQLQASGDRAKTNAAAKEKPERV